MKKALFYDPYLDTLGGGEKYCLTIADYLFKKDWQIDFLWSKPEITPLIKQRFAINGNNFNYLKQPTNIIKKHFLSSRYDLCFWISDGSLPWLYSKNNLLHFQVPFTNVGGTTILNQFKIKKINRIICNSKFTQGIIAKEFKIKGEVIYPPIDVQTFKPGIKENNILYVGRFSKLLQAKRQDILIDVFKKMINQGLEKWNLVLAGATDVGGNEYYSQLVKLAKNYPIKLIENPDFSMLKKLYSEAKIFWSASGYEINEEMFPQKVEHFGMTVVEAMAAGVIPLAYNGGGHREIIDSNIDGYLWKNENELIDLTQKIIKNNELRDKMAKAAVIKAQTFSDKHFLQKIDQIIIC